MDGTRPCYVARMSAGNGVTCQAHRLLREVLGLSAIEHGTSITGRDVLKPLSVNG
jgi:hypothetical protein